jgi:RNA polymerase sigma-70 factor, ECF subfamily
LPHKAGNKPKPGKVRRIFSDFVPWEAGGKLRHSRNPLPGDIMLHVHLPFVREKGAAIAIPSSLNVTQLLLAWSQGEQAALQNLIPVVHAELSRLAHHYMSGERTDHTLQTTALVNEAYLRLVDSSQVQWQNRAHFFAVSAQLMRRILVDFARSKNYLKRGGGGQRVTLDDAMAISAAPDVDLIELDRALGELAAVDARKSQVVELRFFGGLTEEEAAEVLKVSPETIRRDLRMAKSWLLRNMDKQQSQT